MLEDALNNRNSDIELAEENNQQLLTLLEKYDEKLDELQEAAQLKELQVLELHQRCGIELPEIPTETMEQKIDFLKMMLEKLQNMQGDLKGEEYVYVGDTSRLMADETPITYRS